MIYGILYCMNGNFDKEMTKTLLSLKEKKRLLLHSCCAPCSSGCLERLLPYLDVTLFFYNPNLEHDEYILRLDEQKRFIGGFAPDIEIVAPEYIPKEFSDRIAGLESQPERGSRCEKCYALRLEKTARLASERGYDFFATTLTLSPLKPADRINAIGLQLEKEYGVRYLPSDFKKQGGYQRSIALSKEYSLYRQSFCGCKYSMNT